MTAQAPLVAEAQAAPTDRDLASMAEACALTRRAKQAQRGRVAELYQEHLDDLRVVFDLKLP